MSFYHSFTCPGCEAIFELFGPNRAQALTR